MSEWLQHALPPYEWQLGAWTNHCVGGDSGLCYCCGATQTDARAPLQQPGSNHAAAWGSRNLNRVAALHTPVTVFDLRIAGETTQIGRRPVLFTGVELALALLLAAGAVLR